MTPRVPSLCSLPTVTYEVSVGEFIENPRFLSKNLHNHDGKVVLREKERENQVGLVIQNWDTEKREVRLQV